MKLRKVDLRRNKRRYKKSLLEHYASQKPIKTEQDFLEYLDSVVLNDDTFKQLHIDNRQQSRVLANRRLSKISLGGQSSISTALFDKLFDQKAYKGISKLNENSKKKVVQSSSTINLNSARKLLRKIKQVKTNRNEASSVFRKYRD